MTAGLEAKNTTILAGRIYPKKADAF